MKKLIFSLMTLLAAIPALAEDAIIGGADAATNIVVESELSLLGKGLIVTAGGLGGVFLVLILFFLMIKIMHKFLK